mgnify:FL=1
MGYSSKFPTFNCYRFAETESEDMNEHSNPPHLQHADELCVMSGEIPASFLCEYTESDQEKTISKRWFVNPMEGVCEEMTLCGDLDEVDITGLFHTLDECEMRCLL